MASTDPSISSIDGVCHFFRLSGELRNMIYRFALSEPQGLHYREDVDGAGFHPRTEKSSIHSRDSEANQLKYVCRNLHQETRGLGILYNELYFDKFNQAVQFLDSYSQDRHGYLHDIDISDSIFSKEPKSTETMNGFWTITEFCFKHPHVVVREHSELLQSSSRMLACLTMLFQIAFRGSTELAERMITNETLRESLLQLVDEQLDIRSDTNGRQRPVPLNYRLFPTDRSFDEEAFRKAMDDAGQAILDILSTVDGGLDRWITVLKEVYKHGI